MNIKKSIQLRARLAFIGLILLNFVIVWRIVSFQLEKGDKWREKANIAGLRYQTIGAVRGNIYSDNGSLLATSLPFYKVALDPSLASSSVYKSGIDSLSMLLSKKFGNYSAKEFKQRINNVRKSGGKYIVLSKKLVNHLEKKEMQAWPIFREGKIKGGAIFDKVEKRFTPFGNLASRTIGFVNENNEGAGLEYSFNRKLGGVDGKALYRKVGGYKWRPVHSDSDIKPINGLDIQTTLDVNLQDVAQTALLRALQNTKADNGCVVVMEVATGAIKAISNLSLVNKTKHTYGEVYNYAIGNQGLREPGSTFKLASMIALLEDSNLDLDDVVDTGNGKHYFYDKVMTDHKRGGYGKITVRDVFEQSSNIGISKMIDKHFSLSPKRYVSYLESMGLSRPLGFQMLGEGIPYIKSPKDESWSGVTLPWMSIGYELRLTPLHVLAFYNAVANKGEFLKPYIVKTIYQDGKIIEEYDKEIIVDQICSNSTLEKVNEILKGVIDNGTAKNIKSRHYGIAGKTGTAQRLVKGRYTKTYYTSFAGFFPVDNPKYSCIVTIDNPKGYRQYGGDAAAPVFKEISDKIYSKDYDMHQSMAENEVKNKGVFPVIQKGKSEDLIKLCNALDIPNVIGGESEWSKAKIKNDEIHWEPVTIRSGLVPNVVGLTLKDALYTLENMGLVVLFEGMGRVKRQSIPVGRRAKRNDRIFLNLK